MTSQQEHEIAFWVNLKNSVQDFYAFRVAEYEEKTRFFPSFKAQEGIGLDLGSGPVSVLDASGRAVVCLDTLCNLYKERLAIPEEWLALPYEQADGENIPYKNETFDWVFCINMIDHTPNPEQLVAEMHRVLVPGGTLYFEVHFDEHLHGPHYGLWREISVNRIVCPLFICKNIVIEEVPEHRQKRYWVEFKRKD